MSTKKKFFFINLITGFVKRCFWEEIFEDQLSRLFHASLFFLFLLPLTIHHTPLLRGLRLLPFCTHTEKTQTATSHSFEKQKPTEKKRFEKTNQNRRRNEKRRCFAVIFHTTHTDVNVVTLSCVSFAQERELEVPF